MAPSASILKEALSLIETDTSKILGLTVGTHENIQPGQFIPRDEAQPAPEMSFAGASPEKTYLVISLDTDAPFPSWTILGPIIHWVQPGVKVSGETLDITTPAFASYIGPAPPPGSAPHRYTFFLFEEPAGFEKFAPAEGPNLNTWARVRHDFDTWSKEVNLGPLLAFNYFNSN
ncbi:hypothetical protein N7495_001085 [Penicillium taxi]|uniref:uncharacterized protein n=1 Tax=Penicillium taxi TaxID=168475 RepID=UPI002544FBAD|nr:uncharacterized protein N7495_001085 [Penicillium taxi]KAJ5908403.1 hypothetical protein N7495_001085 [Penicillium taxi]